MKTKNQQASRKKGAKRRNAPSTTVNVNSEKIFAVMERLTVVFCLILLIAGSVWGMKWLFQPDTLPIQRVEFHGETQHLSVAVLEQKLLNEIKGGFFSLRIGKLKAFVEAEPWVYEASLRRDWPNGLIVDIEEQWPIARWGESQLLNRFAETFSVPDVDVPSSLPLISGVQGREKDLVEDFIRYDELLAGIGLTLMSLNEDQRHNQKLLLANGAELVLGRERQDRRMFRFTEVYQRTLKDVISSVATLDLRYSNGFSVGWREREETVKSATNVTVNSGMQSMTKSVTKSATKQLAMKW